MYDVGLSALVLKICSDYSQSLGLNFPPNVQQEINAIAKWVDTHTVKDIAFTQDGNVVTVTATTQNNSSQSWVFTLPDISVDKLYTMIKGSNGVNVDYSEDRNTLVVSLDKSQEFQSVKVQSAPTENDDVVRKLELDKKLTKPTNPSAESAVTMLTDGTVGTKPLSEIGGGGKVYQHKIIIYLNSEEFTTFQAIGLYIYSNRTTPYTVNDFPYGAYVGAAYDGANYGALAVSFEDAGIVLMTFGGVIYEDNEVKGVTYHYPLNHNTLSDTVTEL